MERLESTKVWLNKNKGKIFLVIVGVLIYQGLVLQVVKYISPNMEYLVSGKSVYLVNGLEESQCVNKTVKLSRNRFPLTALASFEGSGSTLLRHLIQQVTGYATGSLYRTHKDKLALFSDLAVGDGIKDSRVLLINTHHAFNKVPKAFQIPFERAILLIRNPYDTVKANYDYKKTKSYHKSVDMKELLTEEWQQFAKLEVFKWRNFIMDWLQFKGLLYILRYETLEKDIMLAVSRALIFLQVPVMDKNVPDIICMTKQTKDFVDYTAEYNGTFDQLFPEPLQRTILNTRVKIFRAIRSRICTRKETIS